MEARCGNVSQMFFGFVKDTDKKDFMKWASEHSTFPFLKQCNCHNGRLAIHDLVSISINAL